MNIISKIFGLIKQKKKYIELSEEPIPDLYVHDISELTVPVFHTFPFPQNFVYSGGFISSKTPHTFSFRTDSQKCYWASLYSRHNKHNRDYVIIKGVWERGHPVYEKEVMDENEMNHVIIFDRNEFMRRQGKVKKRKGNEIVFEEDMFYESMVMSSRRKKVLFRSNVFMIERLDGNVLSYFTGCLKNVKKKEIYDGGDFIMHGRNCSFYCYDVKVRSLNNGGYKMKKEKKYHYYGEFKNGKMDGTGIIKYFDGRDIEHYTGLWEKNKMSGNGTGIYQNGSYYIGEWKNGMKNGNGIMYLSNGDVINGKWLNDTISKAKYKHGTMENMSYPRLRVIREKNDNIYQERKKKYCGVFKNVFDDTFNKWNIVGSFRKKRNLEGTDYNNDLKMYITTYYRDLVNYFKEYFKSFYDNTGDDKFTMMNDAINDLYQFICFLAALIKSENKSIFQNLMILGEVRDVVHKSVIESLTRLYRRKNSFKEYLLNQRIKTIQDSSLTMEECGVLKKYISPFGTYEKSKKCLAKLSLSNQTVGEKTEVIEKFSKTYPVEMNTNYVFNKLKDKFKITNEKKFYDIVEREFSFFTNVSTGFFENVDKHLKQICNEISDFEKRKIEDEKFIHAIKALNIVQVATDDAKALYNYLMLVSPDIKDYRTQSHFLNDWHIPMQNNHLDAFVSNSSIFPKDVYSYRISSDTGFVMSMVSTKLLFRLIRKRLIEKDRINKGLPAYTIPGLVKQFLIILVNKDLRTGKVKFVKIPNLSTIEDGVVVEICKVLSDILKLKIKRASENGEDGFSVEFLTISTNDPFHYNRIAIHLDEYIAREKIKESIKMGEL